jgi:hypothetical protein
MTERPSIGDVLCSPTSEARFLVIETGAADSPPSVNGAVLAPGERQACSAPGGGSARDLQGGKRYVDVVTGLMLLCIHPGRGPLDYEGRQMAPEEHRNGRLPSAGTYI